MEKIKTRVIELENLQKKHLLPGFDDRLGDEQSIDRLTEQITTVELRGQESRSKDLFGGPAPAEGSTDEEELDAVFTDAQLAMVQNNDRQITEREKAINDIVKSINGLAEIFKELQTMVIDQGTVLDRIDYNIEMVATHVEGAHGELLQVRMRSCTFVIIDEH
ncbi:hypothetical protein HK101_003985 [Irineochytrium annulatum]|nr:hypothetical protein HK101_003985 [Irineochytrium annulatum]